MFTTDVKPESEIPEELKDLEGMVTTDHRNRNFVWRMGNKEKYYNDKGE